MLRDGLWTEVARSEHAHEREGLDFVRRGLPDREPYRAWSNFTFVALDGRRYEVDLLVVAPTGVYLVELKAWSGKLDGDAAQWTWTLPDGGRPHGRLPALPRRSQGEEAQVAPARPAGLPWRALQPLHRRARVPARPEVTCLLDERARANVFGRDPDRGLESLYMCSASP